MALTLTIENETSLPDGGPLSVRVTGKRGIDIGRDSHLDWTLPDPSRTISAKHCEVRYRDGSYWLYDVSTNGTFLDGQDGRLKGPHRLRNGDRLLIGHYIIAVTVEGEAASAPEAGRPSVGQDFWTDVPDVAPPVRPSDLRAPREQARPHDPDFLDWAADVPNIDGLQVAPYATPSAPAFRAPDDAWAEGPQKAPPAAEAPPSKPTPRRPIWVANEPSGPWTSPAPVAARLGEPAQPEAQGEEPRSNEFSNRQSAGPSAASGDFARLVAQAAGVPEQTFSQSSPEELAQSLGGLLRLVTDNLRQLLAARQQAKRMARSSDQTTIQAVDNNPLKFSPSTDDAIRLMFGPSTRSYLDARRAFEQSFEDLKTHQIKTYSGMQQALAMLVEDLDPEAIDRDTYPDSGLSSLLTSRKAKLWDAYVARWQAKARRSEGGLTDVFMDYFAECYDRVKKLR
jgi:type VI secretion system protein ImpI